MDIKKEIKTLETEITFYKKAIKKLQKKLAAATSEKEKEQILYDIATWEIEIDGNSEQIYNLKKYGKRTV